MFRTSNFDKLLEKATSHLRLEPDWPTILQICDLIRQGDCLPKYALGAIKKKLYSPNPHSAIYALLVLESCVKNCGNLIHDEIGTKQYMEQLRDLVKTTSHDNVKNKVLELIQAWAYAFRNSPKYRAVQDTLNIMKSEGYKFPTLKESDAMFSADTAPEWADGDCCHRCRVQFGMVQRKHHCRACGQVFCGQCSSKTSTLPKFGFEKEVRVCEACYESLNKPSTATPKTESDLPPEYVSSVLSQQSQAPPRKTEEELREEEELQLALALSKSEAEHKEKEKKRTTSAIISNAAAATRAKQYSPPPAVDNSPSHQEEDLDPELARYLNRSYWEKRQNEEATEKTAHGSERDHVGSPLSQQPSAPSNISSPQANKTKQENGETDIQIEEFVSALKSQVEIFVNRMKSNSSRGRSIANDSSVQTLFMNITAMHSRLLRFIQQQDDSRVYFEGLQDKLAQIKDARAALDALREEHREKIRRQAEEAERKRQMQMAHKLEIMRKKKQEYLQYQRQLALQRIQEQEREMQMRQEQQKQQYMMGSMPPMPSMPYSISYIPPGHPQNFPPAGSDASPAHGQFVPNPMMQSGGPASYNSVPPATSGGPTTYRDYPQYAISGHAPRQWYLPQIDGTSQYIGSGQSGVPAPQPGQGPGGPVPMQGPHGSMPLNRPQGSMHGPMPGPMMGPMGPIGPPGPMPGPMMGPMGPQGPPMPVPGPQGPPGPPQMPVQGPPLQNQGPPPPSMQGPMPQVPSNQMIGPQGPMQGPGPQGMPQHFPAGGPMIPPGAGVPPQSVVPGSPQQPPPAQQPPSQQQTQEQQQDPQQQQTAELISFD